MHIAPSHPDFIGEVSGIDISVPLTSGQVAEIELGMDRYAVLVFRDQPLTDEQQCTYSRNFGALEATLISQMSKPSERRLGPVEMGDISNLDPTGKLRGRDDSRRMYALGNRLWHADASFRATGAGYSLLSARIVPGYGGNTEFADMRAAYDALDATTQAKLDDLITEHSIAFSRGVLGFDDYGAGNADKVHPVRHRLVRTHPVSGRQSLYLSAHIGTIVGWPMPEARDFIRDLTEHATQPQVTPCTSLAGQRPGHVGQSHHDAPRSAVSRFARRARPAPHLDQGQGDDRRAGARDGH